jgi:hypothetical protein
MKLLRYPRVPASLGRGIAALALVATAGVAGRPALATTVLSGGAAASAAVAASVAGSAVTTGEAAVTLPPVGPAGCNSPRTQFAPAAMGVVVDAGGGEWTVPSPVTDGPVGADLFNDCTGTGNNAAFESQLQTVVVDPEGVEIMAYVYADNYFELTVNGTFVCRDPIAFTPFNATVCRFRAAYPLTYAIRAVDWETHPGLGMEYDDYRIGDGGFIAFFSDGTVTDATWKAQALYFAPLDNAGCVGTDGLGNPDSSRCPGRPACGRQPASCQALHLPEPEGWAAADFDDSTWPAARTWREMEVNPKPAFSTERRFFGNAQFVWSANLSVDNLVLLRRTVPAPA